MKEEWVSFANALIKQGNSFCVRIPNNVIKETGIRNGGLAAIKIKKLDLELTGNVLEAYYKVANQSVELKHLSKDKIMVLSTLLFNEGKTCLGANKGAVMQDKRQGLNMMKAYNKHREQIKKEFGEKLYKEYLVFAKVMAEKIQKQS
jgi:antitoxin component of MazEF toxin-antitoxin module